MDPVSSSQSSPLPASKGVNVQKYNRRMEFWGRHWYWKSTDQLDKVGSYRRLKGVATRIVDAKKYLRIEPGTAVVLKTHGAGGRAYAIVSDIRCEADSPSFPCAAKDLHLIV